MTRVKLFTDDTHTWLANSIDSWALQNNVDIVSISVTSTGSSYYAYVVYR